MNEQAKKLQLCLKKIGDITVHLRYRSKTTHTHTVSFFLSLIRFSLNSLYKITTTTERKKNTEAYTQHKHNSIRFPQKTVSHTRKTKGKNLSRNKLRRN